MIRQEAQDFRLLLCSFDESNLHHSLSQLAAERDALRQALAQAANDLEAEKSQRASVERAAQDQITSEQNARLAAQSQLVLERTLRAASESAASAERATRVAVEQAANIALSEQRSSFSHALGHVYSRDIADVRHAETQARASLVHLRTSFLHLLHLQRAETMARCAIKAMGKRAFCSISIARMSTVPQAKRVTRSATARARSPPQASPAAASAPKTPIRSKSARVDDATPQPRNRSEARREVPAPNSPRHRSTSQRRPRADDIPSSPAPSHSTLPPRRRVTVSAAPRATQDPPTSPSHEDSQPPVSGPTTHKIFFDGGFRDGSAAAGAFYSSTLWRGKRITGHGNSYVAEVAGAALAYELVLELLAADATITSIVIIGDNLNVINTLASDLVDFRSIPGRSACPGTWARVRDLRTQVNDVLRSRSNSVTIAFQWAARKFNTQADEICTAMLQDRTPDLTLQPPPLPATFAPPSVEGMRAIMERCITTTPDCVRSIPQFLKPLWHQALSHICAWPHALPALLVAPRVLLRRDYDLKTALARFASSPDLVETAYWHFQHDVPLHQVADETVRVSAASPTISPEIINRIAAQSPKKAISLLTARAPLIHPSSPEATSALDEKLGKSPNTTPFPTLENENIPLPKWVSIDTIMALAARRLSRLAAPGHDGWTREIFISSVCRGTAPVIEMLINATLRGELDLGDYDLTRAARICLWKKENGSLRLIGMTSTITKIAWRCAIVQHLVGRKAPHNAALLPAGVFRVIRALEHEMEIYVADVKDAFYNVDLHRADLALRQRKSPMIFLFRHVYATNPIAAGGGVLRRVCKGVLPGCGGAAVIFATDFEERIKSLPSKSDIHAYMDDANTSKRAAFEAMIRALGPDTLTKLKLIAPNHPSSSVEICGLQVPVVKAAKLLGAFVGEAEEAANLLRTHCNIKLITARLIAAHAGLSTQAKFQMIRCVFSAISWAFAASKPEVTSRVAHLIDDDVRLIVHSLLPQDAVPNHKTGELISLPHAPGGLGLTSLHEHAHLLYAMATAAVNRTTTDADPMPAITAGYLYKQLVEQATIKCTLSKVQLAVRKDSNTPWHGVQAVTRRTTLSDDAFSLALAHTIDATTPYPVCSRWTTDELPIDHSHTCGVCAPPYRYPRHQRVLHEIMQVCNAFGIITTTNFFLLGVGAKQKRPDLIIFRGKTRENPLVIDVSVCHQAAKHNYNTMAQRHSSKMRKYKSQFLGEATFHPFVVSTRATFEDRTSKLIPQIAEQAVRKGFARELSNRIKVALLEYEVFRRKALNLRKTNGTLDREATDATIPRFAVSDSDSDSGVQDDT